MLTYFDDRECFISNVTSNFSEAGHGKGAPDGVGAAIKRSADELVAQRADLTNANVAFLKLSERSNSSLKLFFVPAREVDGADDIVPLRLSTVKCTMRIRQLGSWACLKYGIASSVFFANTRSDVTAILLPNTNSVNQRELTQPKTLEKVMSIRPFRA